jgi:hypothetical protein
VNDLQWFLSLFIFRLGVFMPHRRSYQGKIIQHQREQDYAAIKVQRTAAWQYIRETEFRDCLIVSDGWAVDGQFNFC